MTTPISVIVTYYNERHYIAEAIASVRAQTHPAIELIVVDDGSAQPLSDHIDVTDFTYIRQDNGGDGKARNTGVRHASHPLIAFLDADDLWPPQRLMILSAAQEARPTAALAYGQVKQFISPELPEESRAHIHCSPELQAGLMPTGMVIRRDCFEQIGWFSEDRQIHSLMEWMGKVRAARFDLVAVDDVVLYRRLHDTNMSHNKVEKSQRLLRAARGMITQRRNSAEQ